MAGYVSSCESVRAAGFGAISAPWRRLSHDFSWILIGNTAFAASQWGIVAILARYSTPEILGAYALGLSIAGVTLGLTNLELRTLQVTDHAQQIPFATYYVLRRATGLAGVAAAGAAALLLPYSAATRLAVVAVAFSRCLDSLSDVIYARLQVCDMTAPIGKSQFTKAVLSIVLLGLAIAAFPNRLWAFGATVVPYATVLFFYDAPNLRRYGKATIPALRALFDSPRGEVRYLARMGLPLTMVATMVMLHPAIPRLVVASHLGESAAGVFTALGYLAVAPNLLVTALGMASLKSLAGCLAQGDRSGFLMGVLRMLGIAAAIGMTVLLGGFCFGGIILSAVYGPRFVGYERELMLFLGAGAVSYLNAAVGYSLSSARVFAKQVPMMAAVCAISLAASLWLAPEWGLVGAVASQLISMLVQLIWSSVLLASAIAKRFRLSPPECLCRH